MLPERTSSNWITTFNGHQFWPLNPRTEDLDIQDIAHALSNICRFTGHTRHFYSVAQHSVLASEWCNPDIARWCLMHDAAEAYINDIAKPVKRCLDIVNEAETVILKLVSEVWGLLWPMPEYVKTIDLRMLATERRDVVPHSFKHAWHSTENTTPYPEIIEPWPSLTAEAKFLNRFYVLFGFDR